MKNHYFIHFIILFFISIISFNAFGQKPDSVFYDAIYDTVTPKNDLLDFPMKNIMDIKVTVASKKEEKISDAPSSITAYSSKDFENLGYYTLGDLAAITSGYSVNYQFGESGFETRGQTAGGFNNNKHLLLIDGIPVNFARSYKAQTQEELPIFFAQRVEFLKGPASALYGVSAFYGVISLISKDPSSNGTIAESKFSGGNGGNWNNQDRIMASTRVMGNVLHRSEKGITSINVGYYHKNPSADFIGSTDNDDYRYWDKNTSIFMKSSHKFTNGRFNGLSIGMIFMQRNGGLGESWPINISSEVNNILWRTVVPYVKYQRQLTKKLIFNSYLKGNNSVEEGQFRLFDKAVADTLAPYKALSIYRSNVVNVELLAEMRYELNTRNSFIAGVNYDRRVEKGNPSSYAYNAVAPDTTGKTFTFPLVWDFTKRSFYFNTLSGYVQYQKNIPFLSGLTITGGLRYDIGIIDTFNYDQFSPRIAIVQKLTSRLNLKIMTGRALRAPGIKELGLTSQFLEELKRNNFPSPNLPAIKPEVIQTYEAGLNYNTSSIRISTTLFYNETVNQMRTTVLKKTNGKDTLRGNWIENLSGTTTSKGFEVDFMAVINNKFKLFSNYTYAIARDSSDNYFAGIPLSRVNTGITYSATGKFKFKSSIVAKYIDGYLTGEKGRKVNSGYTFIDINCILPLADNVSLELQVRNLLNQHIKFPTAGIPLPGITYLATLGITF